MSSISIHAPRVGSDRVKAVFLGLCFQFQSTLPVWGATFWICPAATQLLYFNPRSPCGERRGVGSYNGLTPLFQSTLPVWGATTSSGLAKFSSRKFQSTLPVWGATPLIAELISKIIISIHAPRVGSDPGGPCCGYLSEYFNPRSPCGERQQRCTDFSFASSAKRVFFCDILQIGRHLQGIGRKRWGDFLSRSVRTFRGKYGYLAFAFRESGGLRENRRFYSQSVLFSFRIDCQGSRILGCPFRGP